MRNAAIRAVLHAWAESITNPIGGASIVPIIWVGQNGPRPIPPYLELQYVGGRDIGQPWFAYVKTTGVAAGLQQITQPEDTTFAVQGYGNDSEVMIECLRESLRKNTVVDKLRIAGLVVRNIMDIRDTSALLDTINESRWTWEFVMGSTQVINDDPGYILDVEITNEITAP